MNIGLVLSGGMAKGAYQLGALRAIREYIEPKDVKYISAASIGALNGYAYTSDNLDAASFMWHSVNLTHNRVLLTTLLKSEFLNEVILRLSKKQAQCEKLYVPYLCLQNLSVLYTDIASKSGDELKDALTAGISVPFVSPSVPVNGMRMLDGAVIDEIPVYPLLKLNLDYIIFIYFDEYNYTFETRYFDNKIIKINFKDDEKLTDTIWFEKGSIKDMELRGYRKAKAIMEFVFASGEENIESIYEKIDSLNAINTRRIHRTTKDVVSENLEKLKKRIARRRILE